MVIADNTMICYDTLRGCTLVFLFTVRPCWDTIPALRPAVEERTWASGQGYC